MGNIVHTLTNRRYEEKYIAYAESHDQVFSAVCLFIAKQKILFRSLVVVCVVFFFLVGWGFFYFGFFGGFFWFFVCFSLMRKGWQE